MDMLPNLEFGTVSRNVIVENSVIRLMYDDDGEYQIFRLQGRVMNICQFALGSVKCDLSYFDSNGSFLGLDMSSFTDLDEIDPDEVAPFDIELNIPIGTIRCVLNVHAKKILQDVAVALKEYLDQETDINTSDEGGNEPTRQ